MQTFRHFNIYNANFQTLTKYITLVVGSQNVNQTSVIFFLKKMIKKDRKKWKGKKWSHDDRFCKDALGTTWTSSYFKMIKKKKNASNDWPMGRGVLIY